MRTKAAVVQSEDEVRIQGFLDMISPSVVKFNTDHFICGNTYRSVWALREYPTATDEQAILSHLGEKDGVTLRIYTRQVTPVEERRIISNAANKNRMQRSNTNDLQQNVTAEIRRTIPCVLQEPPSLTVFQLLILQSFGAILEKQRKPGMPRKSRGGRKE